MKNLSFQSLFKNKRILVSAIALIIFICASFFIVNNNEGLYSKNIAKIMSVTEKNSQSKSQNGKSEEITEQNIKAIIMNGKHKGQTIGLENTTSYSEVNDLNLKPKNEVFVSISEDSKGHIISCKINDFKRDNYLVYITSLFVVLILIVGGIKGFKSLASLVINTLIFFLIIEMFLNNFNLASIFIVSVFLFVILSILIVCGINKKAISAIAAAIASTFITMLIALVVIKLNHSNGVHFEELEFLTHPPEQLFYIELLIGTLGAIMDIAISISSSINEIFNSNPAIEKKLLIKSGREIGKDIMGTMSNTLLFAYISGSIPIILLLLRNEFPISNIVGEYLSLEIIRALVGSIGVVLSIPITIFTSIMLLKNTRIGGFIKS
ncbi:YibE/F family protein [Clostridium hydrogenum]|uniref:YibE/F family protein n=1 Tax=Clostridium hydrogenum TaxID=2855764 RepID=UPI001F1E7434|nr:YibE/F family protein [Clostridium hydrogenum]